MQEQCQKIKGNWRKAYVLYVSKAQQFTYVRSSEQIMEISTSRSISEHSEIKWEKETVLEIGK